MTTTDMNYPIRVLQVVTCMNRNGYENRIMDIYRNIDRNKIQFDFLTHRLERGQFDDEIESLGGKIYRFPPLKPQRIFQYYRSLCEFFNQNKYLIVHAHLNAYCTWVLNAAKKHGVPIRVAHSRNSGMDHDWKAIFKFGSKLFVNIPTTHKFACSRQAGEWLFGKKGIQEPNYFRVIPNGFDLSKFRYSVEKREEIRKQLDIGVDETAIVHVGRLTYQKNHTFLLDVFREILKRKPNSKLVLIGDGELKSEIEAKIQEIGIQHSVVLLGSIPNVGDYLSAMDAMIFPSVYEGFGTVVLETQCNGLPTLSSDVLPQETKVTECEDFMSLKHSAEEWAERILQMIQATPRRDRMQEVKDAGYDINDSYKMLFDFYMDRIKDVQKTQ